MDQQTLGSVYQQSAFLVPPTSPPSTCTDCAVQAAPAAHDGLGSISSTRALLAECQPRCAHCRGPRNQSHTRHPATLVMVPDCTCVVYGAHVVYGSAAHACGIGPTAHVWRMGTAHIGYTCRQQCFQQQASVGKIWGRYVQDHPMSCIDYNHCNPRTTVALQSKLPCAVCPLHAVYPPCAGLCFLWVAGLGPPFYFPCGEERCRGM